MFDVFYNSTKPNIFPHEKYAETIEQALVLSKTKFFWWLHGENDYTDFNFDFAPSPWEEKYRHVWIDEKNIGRLTFLVNTRGLNPFQDFYHKDAPVREKIDWTPWAVPSDIDRKSFDFTWKHDPGDPPYIYQFGTQWQKTGGPRYTVSGATEVKYIESPKAKKLSHNKERWTVSELVDMDIFDYSWHPDDTEPPFIYIFGTKEIKAEKREVARYTVPGANQIKYMDHPIKLKIDYLLWDIPNDIDLESFDFTWEPPLHDPPYIYQFPSQWRKTGGPRYKVPGATEIKFMQHPVATRKQMFNEWVIPEDIDRDSFDFSWQPSEHELAYIFQFPSQWRKNGGPTHIGSGGTEIKYMTGPIAKRKPQYNNWDIPEDIDRNSFDFSWQPSEHELAYIFQFPSQWRKNGGPRYISPGATQIKYLDSPVAKRLPNLKDWAIPDEIDKNAFDFSWQPGEHDPPLVYQFGTQWQKTGGPQYVPHGVQEMKYVTEVKARRLPVFDNWDIPDDVDRDSFDFSWHPDERDAPLIYQFGTQWQKTGGPRYVVAGATDIKYLDILIAKKISKVRDHWNISEEADADEIDYTWHPDDTEPPYIYIFGSTVAGPEIREMARYVVPGATEKKYITDLKIPFKEDKTYWAYDKEIIDENSIDFRWRPHPFEPPLIYQFGTQWQKNGGPRHVVPGATEVKYCNDFVARRLPNKRYWHLDPTVDYSTFDFSWHPEESQRQYKHIFGTQWQDVTNTFYYEGTDENPPVNYIKDFRITSGSSYLPRYYIETTLDNLVKEHPTERFWALSKTINYDKFDFTWHPDTSQFDYVHVFGTEWQKDSQTYLINGPAYAAGNKQLNYVDAVKAEAQITSDIFYVDKLNYKSAERFKKLKERFPSIQKTRMINGILETIKRCAAKATTERFWIITSDIEYNSFNFSWHPSSWQRGMTHIFGSKNQPWSETMLILKDDFLRSLRWCKSLKDFPNLNFVNDQYIDIPNDFYDKFFISRTEKEPGTYKKLRNKFNNITYINGYTDIHEAYLEASKQAKTDMFWVVDSDSEIDNEFDFKYPVPAWDSEYVHICKQGDRHSGVYLIPSKKEITRKETKYRFFRNSKTLDINASHYRPWDIFFISYNEPDADLHWNKLKKKFPTAIRISNIKGIYNAHKIAAETSGTKMFYVVDGDADILDTFDFNLTVPKWDQDSVYVWHSRNPINGLEYGYGGVKLLPKDKVLELDFKGTDMTISISEKFNIIKEVSNITAFNTDEFSTWKSAFRECVKLTSGLARQDNEETKERLRIWCEVGAEQKYGIWAISGANDGKEYASNSDNDLTLINNFEWLREYYGKKYNT